MRTGVADELKHFVESTAPDCDWNKVVGVDIGRQLDVLGTLFEMLRQNADAILGAPYESECEEAADDLVREMAWGNFEHFDADLHVSRILIERVTQATGVAATNAQLGCGAMPMPDGLSEFTETGAIIIWWLLKMDLPWPPNAQTIRRTISLLEKKEKAGLH